MNWLRTEAISFTRSFTVVENPSSICTEHNQTTNHIAVSVPSKRSRVRCVACAVTAILREEEANGMALVLTTERWCFSISDSTFTNSPFLFSHWILTRMEEFPSRLAVILGKAWEEGFASELEIWWQARRCSDFLTRLVDATVFSEAFSSKVFTFSSSCLM